MTKFLKKTLGWFNQKDSINSSWTDRARLVEIHTIDVLEDPVRPELDLEWRKAFGRKIFGLQCEDEILAVVCLAFTNDVPHSVRELDLMSRVSQYEKNAMIAIAYTVWSEKKGAGKKIMEEVIEYAIAKGFKRLVTLSPLTPTATHYHIRNEARLIGLNASTQNFEYRLKD